MERKKSFGTKLEHFLTGKGFYIVLFLCIAVIGVSAWIMLFYDKEEDTPGTAATFTTDVISSERIPENKAPSVHLEPEMAEEERETPYAEPVIAEQTEDEPAVSPVEQEDEAVPVISASHSYIWPLSGNIMTDYSVDALIYSKTMNDWRTHDGIDISTKVGTKVLAISDGTVKEVYDDDLYGTTVVIEHGNGLTSIYSNMAGMPTVNAGDTVSLGDVIGSVGTTALVESSEQPHLHLAMQKDGNSVNPIEYMPAKLG